MVPKQTVKGNDQDITTRLEDNMLVFNCAIKMMQQEKPRSLLSSHKCQESLKINHSPFKKMSFFWFF